MLRPLLILLALALTLFTFIGCTKTIYEPGEPEHGGVFLHGNPSNAPANTNP
jgi:hypothetical protein